MQYWIFFKQNQLFFPVSVGSQGVGDALQRCHSTARELQHNHTEMAAKLDKLILRTDNLTAQVYIFLRFNNQ